jgi:transposase, IS30 family
MAVNKHLTESDRYQIEHSLNDAYSLKSIGRELNRDCTTIAKEVKKHIILKKTGAYGKAFNNCLHRHDCKHSNLCDSPTCRNRYCRFCSKCTSICPDFVEEKCKKLLKPPYVCYAEKITIPKHQKNQLFMPVIPN